MPIPLRILYCNCSYANVVPKATKAAVLRGLAESGIPFDAVPDLCEMSSKKDPALHELAGEGVKIAACYPRAVRWLFSAAGAKLGTDNVEILNMRTESPDSVLAKLLEIPEATA